jgi:hypothetical protein
MAAPLYYRVNELSSSVRGLVPPANGRMEGVERRRLRIECIPARSRFYFAGAIFLCAQNVSSYHVSHTCTVFAASF